MVTTNIISNSIIMPLGYESPSTPLMVDVANVYDKNVIMINNVSVANPKLTINENSVPKARVKLDDKSVPKPKVRKLY